MRHLRLRRIRRADPACLLEEIGGDAHLAPEPLEAAEGRDEVDGNPFLVDAPGEVRDRVRGCLVDVMEDLPGLASQPRVLRQ